MTLDISDTSSWSLPDVCCMLSSQYKRFLDTCDGHGRSQALLISRISCNIHLKNNNNNKNNKLIKIKTKNKDNY